MSSNSTNVISALGYRIGTKPPIVWGYPDGVSIVDLVPHDMLDMIHPHWKQFQPINPMWHYLLGLIYIVLGITSITGIVFFFVNHLNSYLNFIKLLCRKFARYILILFDEGTQNTSEPICSQPCLFGLDDDADAVSNICL